MGEYIRTGIITEFRIYPSQVSKMDMHLIETRIGLATAIVGNPQSFDCKEEDGELVWKLKPNVIEVHLPGFLRRYFNDFYEEGSALYNKYCKLTLDYLSKGPSRDELYEWLEGEDDCELTIEDDERRFINFAKCEVCVSISYMELTYEGKVMYEELERHVEFFESALRKAYGDDALGGCLMITIG